MSERNLTAMSITADQAAAELRRRQLPKDDPLRKAQADTKSPLFSMTGAELRALAGKKAPAGLTQGEQKFAHFAAKTAARKAAKAQTVDLTDDAAAVLRKLLGIS